jgi:glycosyltransferase involved in cell wall biosynthesis
MKILITNHHLDSRAGSELFTATLALELKKRNHHVYVFSPILGKISDEIKKGGIIVVDDLRILKEKKFDIIHAQHNDTAILARSIFPDVSMIFMSHGVLPELEQVPSIDLGIGKFVAVSEEVRENLINRGGIEEGKIEIVRNFVDMERFFSKKVINPSPKNLLVISNHYVEEVRNVIEGACSDLDIVVSHIGLPDNPVMNVESYINDADIVVTLGRGSLEAMACERNVIVFDMHGGGWLY